MYFENDLNAQSVKRSVSPLASSNYTPSPFNTDGFITKGNNIQSPFDKDGFITKGITDFLKITIPEQKEESFFSEGSASPQEATYLEHNTVSYIKRSPKETMKIIKEGLIKQKILFEEKIDKYKLKCITTESTIGSMSQWEVCYCAKILFPDRNLDGMSFPDITNLVLQNLHNLPTKISCGKVNFHVRIWKEKNTQKHVVEFQKRCGCSISFWKIYRGALNYLIEHGVCDGEIVPYKGINFYPTPVDTTEMFDLPDLSNTSIVLGNNQESM